MARQDASSRLNQAATEAGIDVAPVRYPEGTRTAADAATAIGCELAQIVKSLVCIGPDGPVLALTAGHNRVDLDRLAEVVGGPVRMAGAEEAREVTGYAIGGTPPFGHPRPITTFIDPDLGDHPIVYAASGTPDSCFPIGCAALIEVTGARSVRFTVD